MDCQSLLSLIDPTDGSLPELASRYRLARTWAHDFAEIADMIELELAAMMETDAEPVPGVGLLVRKLEHRSTWRDEYASNAFRREIADRVVKEIALDLATGELEPIKRNVATATVNLMLDIVPSFSSVKARGRAIGIDISEFRSWSDVYRVAVAEESDDG